MEKNNAKKKKKWERLLKFSVPTNQSTNPQSIDRLVNALWFPFFAHFPFLNPPIAFLSWIPPIFYAQCQRNFDFW